MVVADRETVSVLGNNWVKLRCPNLGAMGCGGDRAFEQIWIEILAASIKSPSEAVKTLLAGAPHLTLPFDVLQAMTVHELSQQTVDEFANNGPGISY